MRSRTGACPTNSISLSDIVAGRDASPSSRASLTLRRWRAPCRARAARRRSGRPVGSCAGALRHPRYRPGSDRGATRSRNGHGRRGSTVEVDDVAGPGVVERRRCELRVRRFELRSTTTSTLALSAVDGRGQRRAPLDAIGGHETRRLAWIEVGPRPVVVRVRMERTLRTARRTPSTIATESSVDGEARGARLSSSPFWSEAMTWIGRRVHRR